MKAENSSEKKMTEGKYIPKAIVDWNYDEDEYRRYKFAVELKNHCFEPNDKIKLSVIGRPQTCTATILECHDDGFIVLADGWVDISEEYSIESID